MSIDEIEANETFGESLKTKWRREERKSFLSKMNKKANRRDRY